MGAIAAVAVGCGGSSEISPEQVASIKTEAKRELQSEQRRREADRKLRQLERELRDLKKKSKSPKRTSEGSAPAPPSGGGSSGSSCGGGVSVNSVTTCPFAANVAAAFYDGGPGTVYATSPITGQTYAMSCRAGVPTVCTGGNGAAVYIR
jgi:hypothetical protein